MNSLGILFKILLIIATAQESRDTTAMNSEASLLYERAMLLLEIEADSNALDSCVELLNSSLAVQQNKHVAWNILAFQLLIESEVEVVKQLKAMEMHSPEDPDIKLCLGILYFETEDSSLCTTKLLEADSAYSKLLDGLDTLSIARYHTLNCYALCNKLLDREHVVFSIYSQVVELEKLYKPIEIKLVNEDFMNHLVYEQKGTGEQLIKFLNKLNR